MSWEFDYGHARIGFSGRHLMVATVRGEFEKFNGTIEFDENNLPATSLQVQIEAASLNSRNADRDAHLRSADFLDAEHYPYLYFQSKQVQVAPNGKDIKLVGDLTIKDVTREVVLEVEYFGISKAPWGVYSAGFSAHTKISRKNWNLTWNAMLEAGGVAVSDEIKIEIEMELTKPVEQPALSGAAQA